MSSLTEHHTINYNGNMAFNIQACQHDDLYDISRVFNEALPGTMEWLLPECSAEEIIQYLLKINSKEFKKPGRRCFKAVDTETGTTVGTMIMHEPYTLKPGQPLVPAYGTDVTPPQGGSIENCDTFWGGMGETQAKYLDHNTMYFVNALAVSPEYQRKGLGTRLLKICTDLADLNGSKTYIEASSKGAPLYARLGWNDIEEATEKSRLRYMLRDPIVA